MNQFGWTMAISIMVSMLVAFTLTPTLSARLLKREIKREGHDGGTVITAAGWNACMCGVSNGRWRIAGRSWRSALSTLGSTFIVNKYIGRDWMPQEDQSELGIWLELPEGSSLEATEKLALEVGKKLEKIPGVRAVVPQSSNTLHRARDDVADHAAAGRSVETRRNRRDGPEGARSDHAITRIARPSITFPNALGGRDTFAPIRAHAAWARDAAAGRDGEGSQRQDDEAARR